MRVRIAGHNTDGSGATSDFTWSTLTSIQKDTADYAGLARIGIRIKATGQLNGQPERSAASPAEPAPVWTEAGWATKETNNPGALILAYARGFRDEHGKLIAGIGLDDVQIDIEALKAFMLFCQANGYGYSNYIKDVRNHDDVLNAVALAGFGQITWPAAACRWCGPGRAAVRRGQHGHHQEGQFQVDYPGQRRRRDRVQLLRRHRLDDQDPARGCARRNHHAQPGHCGGRGHHQRGARRADGALPPGAVPLPVQGHHLQHGH